MKILLLGKDGQIGRELFRALSPLGQVIACGRAEADLENLEHLRQKIRETSPDIIVNAAAYTAVDNAENETDKVFAINAKAVQVIAEEARKLDVWLVHYSTDYIFDGLKATPYTEEDVPAPLNAYGHSKLAGEQAIQDCHDKYLILRTSWVYSAHSRNFLRTILNLAKTRTGLSIVSDQFGAPTSAAFLADVTALMLAKIEGKEQVESGIYHLTATGSTSWYELACLAVELANRADYGLVLKKEGIVPILARDYNALAKRPENSRLDCSKLQKLLGIQFPDWKDHVHGIIEQKDILCLEKE